MVVDTILFDLDGTLVDSAADLAAAVNRLREEIGLQLLETVEVCAMIGDGATMLVRRALPDGLFSAARLQRFLELYRQGLSDHTLPYPGIRKFLKKHPPGKLGVVTNKPLLLAEELLARLQLRTLFGTVVGGDSCTHKKPRPEPVFLAIQQLGADPTRTVMVGDHYVDLAAGHAAGVRTCFCTWGFGYDKGLPYDFRAETPADLPRLFPDGLR